MKKIKNILVVIPILLLSLCFLSCKKDELTDFQKVVKCIYDSEEVLAGYNETNIIKDNDFEVYNKNINFKIQRGEKVKSQVTITEKKLSTSGLTMYDETITSYSTIDNVKYSVVNGVTYENTYQMPTYYLTFVLSEEFFESYDLSIEDDNYILTGKVYDNKISSLFLNKSLTGVKNMTTKIIVMDGKLKSFEASYESNTGFTTNINISYLYGIAGQGKAVFYLEGGNCQNTKERISYIYQFDNAMLDTLIVDPNELDPEDPIIKTGYHIEGWYKTKSVNPDGTIEYSDKWDFANDRMTIDGVTLYAKWEIDRVYKYELYYKKDGKDVFLDSYVVKEGEKFNDLFLDNKKVDGYTSLGYLDSEGYNWDNSFTHPGGDNDLAIKVYLNLIEGEYTIVKNKRQLNSALTGNKDIYLLNDIDYGGNKICFDSYSGTIIGNGYTISNFRIDYDTTRNGLRPSLDDSEGAKDHLYISLFYEMKDAVIKNLKFDKVTIDINTTYSQIKYIVVSPLAIISSNVTLENVQFNASITFTKVPECEMQIIYDDFWYSKSDNVTVDEQSSATIVDYSSSGN